jgi:hypothetical protein
MKRKVSTPTTCQFWQIHFFTWFRTMSADACNWRFQQQLRVNFDKSFVLLGLHHAAPDRKPQWGVNLLLLWDQEWQHLPKVRVLSFRTPMFIFLILKLWNGSSLFGYMLWCSQINFIYLLNDWSFKVICLICLSYGHLGVILV